jgi:hypothetical protein
VQIIAGPRRVLKLPRSEDESNPAEEEHGRGNGRGTRRGGPGREEVTQVEAPTKQEVNEPTPSTANARSQRRLVQEELYKNMATYSQLLNDEQCNVT